MNSEPDLDPDLAVQLLELQQSPPRDAQRAARARDAFLAEAGQIPARVSNLPPNRLDRWQDRFGTLRFTRGREKKNVFTLVTTALLALAVIFGGGVTTVALAQGAQPSEPLYLVKTWTEDIRLEWESDPETKLGLALQFTARRAAEVNTALQAKGVIPEELQARFRNQLQQVLRLAGGMPDDLIVPALERVRDQARQQEHSMAQLQLESPTAVQTGDQVRAMLQMQAHIAQQGIEDPAWLREQFRLRDREQVGPETPQQGITTGEGTATAGGNPWTSGTPMPGSRNGTGEWQNAWADGTPTPGSGYGPGPGTGDCSDCTVQPNTGSGYGPRPGMGDCMDCTAQPNTGSGPRPGK